MNAKRRHRRRRRRDKQRALAWDQFKRSIDWANVELTINGEPFAQGYGTVRNHGVYTLECTMTMSGAPL